MGTAIKQCLAGKASSQERLYFLDGTFPGDLPGDFTDYEDVPGTGFVPVVLCTLLITYTSTSRRKARVQSIVCNVRCMLAFRTRLGHA